MHFFHAGDLIRDRIPRHFMDKLSETGVFLWRTADDGKGPYRIFAGVDLMHPHQRKRMLQAVISEVITKWPLGFCFAGMDLSGDHEIRIRAHAEAIAVGVPESATAQQTGEGHFAEAFRKRHHGGDGMRRRTSGEDTHFQRLSLTVSLGLMHANASVQLIM